ncbi:MULTISPECIES: hypothetical protein [unclassified Microbacterium]|uniref:hypothetical protein n=1 Tax=unclassified Microbacterium TaxID=2609290 RepID=UPI0016055E4A|nr:MULTISPECIES: hypothetical protein [unclassified Microbacterium]QNA93276.1 hypothetical protein G4G29_14830 [Microbacterium sp. Se63.02b]QYM63486.1 hypothetical protein K1X59_14880 [Microbacterium sp. Se5.02b]
MDWSDAGQRLLTQANDTNLRVHLAMPFAAGSPFQQIAAGQERFATDTIAPNAITDAIASAGASIIAALDCLRALGASMVAGDPVYGFAAGSLVRSAIESLGRAWYLIEPNDAEELLSRWMRLRLANSENALKERIKNPDDFARAKATHDQLLAAAAPFGISKKDRAISFGRLFIDVVDMAFARMRSLEGHSGSTEYSFLSSLAHGEDSGHHQMSEVLVRGGGAYGLNLVQFGLSGDAYARCLIVLVPTYLNVVAHYLLGAGAQRPEVEEWWATAMEALKRPGATQPPHPSG